MKTRPPAKTRTRRKTHFVPRVVYRTAFVGVVPVCVVGTACGSGSSGGDAGPNLAVACSGFCAVAMQAFAEAGDGSGRSSDAATDASTADAGEGSCSPFCDAGIDAFTDAGD